MTSQVKALLVLLLFAVCCAAADAVNVEAECSKYLEENYTQFNCSIEVVKNIEDEQGTSYVVTNVTFSTNEQISNDDIMEVSIKNNPLEVIPQGLVKFVQNIRWLEVDNIKHLDKGDLAGLVNLKRLNLTASAPTDVPFAFFKDNTGLSNVNLRGLIKNISEDIFDYTSAYDPRLNYINNYNDENDDNVELFYCHDPAMATGAVLQRECNVYGYFSSFDKFLSMNGTEIHYDDIKTLRIFFNVHGKTEFFNKFKNIEELRLKGDLGDLNHNFMRNSSQLVKLDLSDCKTHFPFIRSNIFSSNPKLNYVNLANNNILNIGSLTFQSIDNVDLSGNPCTNKIYNRETKHELVNDIKRLKCDYI